MFSDYRFVRSVIDESNCFCACASISLSIQYIHHYFFLISKTGILQCKTAQVLRDGYGGVSPRTATLLSPCRAWETIPLSFVRRKVPRARCGHTLRFCWIGRANARMQSKFTVFIVEKSGHTRRPSWLTATTQRISSSTCVPGTLKYFRRLPLRKRREGLSLSILGSV